MRRIPGGRNDGNSVRQSQSGEESAAGLAALRSGLGLDAGKKDPLAIVPSEALKLFLTVTPMRDELRDRAAVVLDRGILSPERLCFTLMSGTWGPVEMTELLATPPRVESILKGGSDFDRRRERLAETESCRAALMAGMLFRGLTPKDTAAGGSRGVRVFKDG